MLRQYGYDRFLIFYYRDLQRFKTDFFYDSQVLDKKVILFRRLYHS